MLNIARFKKAAALLKKPENILITTHTKPDGNACEIKFYHILSPEKQLDRCI